MKVSLTVCGAAMAYRTCAQNVQGCHERGIALRQRVKGGRAASGLLGGRGRGTRTALSS